MIINKEKAGFQKPAKKKLNKADYMFKSRTGEFLYKAPGAIDGNAFMIKDLKDCTVVLMDHVAQITVDRCQNVKFFFGPIKSSVFLRDCKDCEVTVSCSQFRCRDLIDSKVNLYTPNDPIIESSSGLTIGPFNWKYPLLKQHSVLAEVIGDFKDDSGTMVTKTNKWNLIFDFTKRDDGALNYEL